MFSQKKYAVIGAGPAAIAELIMMLKNGISADDIVWIDPKFQAGDFGGQLSEGSSVPGNTKTASYRKVYQEMFEALPFLAPGADQFFELDQLPPNHACLLNIAAEHLHHITKQLRKIIFSIEGKVTDVINKPTGSLLSIDSNTGKSTALLAEHVTIATGGIPRPYQFPHEHSNIVMIDPNISFNESKLQEFLRNNPTVKRVAVVGSSHSAALATMHFLKAGISVTQLMNKEYEYYEEKLAPDGKIIRLHDDSGLKGSVATFTKQLFAEITAGKSQFQGTFSLYISKTPREYDYHLKHLSGCTHAVACVGYTVNPSLKVNGVALDEFKQNIETMELIGLTNIKGIGLAFPGKPTAGETKPPVGVTKFWETAKKLAPGKNFASGSKAVFFKSAVNSYTKNVEVKLELQAKL